MSTIELRNKLHSLIDSISDNEKLKALLTLLNANDSTKDWFDNLSDSHKKSIERGISDIKNRRVTNDEEARNEIDKYIAENYG